MKKCWQIKNELGSDTAEILLYGPIADETWWGDETTPRQFATDLAALNSKDVTVRINSGGGDVFAAHAIYNQLETYSGNVTVRIDGLAASAATIIAMAGNKTIASANSVVMIHNPALGLFGYYTAAEFEKMAKDLAVIKDSIIASYKKKCTVDEKKLSNLMDDETYMNAQEAQNYGFIDEIDGVSDIVMSNKYLVVNSVCHDLDRLRHTDNLKSVINIEEKRVKSMDVLAELKKLLGDQDKNPAQVVQNNVEEAVKAERERILALDALQDGNKAIAAIIADAKQTGKTAADVQFYVNVIKNNAPDDNENNQAKAVAAIVAAINDSKASGVENVTGSPTDDSVNDAKEAASAMDYMAKIVNQKNGVKVNGRVNWE